MLVSAIVFRDDPQLAVVAASPVKALHSHDRSIRARGRLLEAAVDPGQWRARRVRGILDSIQQDLDRGGTPRVRRILQEPRELYRLELELPELAYQRITILDRETLTHLLEKLPERSLGDRFAIR